MAPKQDPKPKFQEGERGAGGRLGAGRGRKGQRERAGGLRYPRLGPRGLLALGGALGLGCVGQHRAPEREGSARPRPRPLRRGDCSGRAGGPPGLLSSSSRPCCPSGLRLPFSPPCHAQSA